MSDLKQPNDRPPVCDYEGSTYQTSFWEQGGRAYEDGTEAVALKRLLPGGGGGKGLILIGLILVAAVAFDQFARSRNQLAT